MLSLLQPAVLRVPRRALLFATLCVAALGSGFGASQASASAVPSSFIGITAEDTFAQPGAYRSEQLVQQKAVGVGLFRQVFRWSDIEKTRGQYDFTFYDQYVIDAANKGITILPILLDAPAFRAAALPSNAKANTSRVPKSNTDLGNFAALLVRRYGPKGSVWAGHAKARQYAIRSWQVWNEPNIPIYWGGRKPNSGNYVKMLAATAVGIKHADRYAEVVTAGIPDTRLGGAQPLTPYVQGMLRAKAHRYAQTFAVNAYARTAASTATVVSRLRKQMDQGNARKTKIWLTEGGWADSGPKHRFNLGSEQAQATQITKLLTILAQQRTKLLLRGIVYYNWRDGLPYNGHDFVGLHQGLLRVNGKHKRAFGAFGAAVRKIRR